MNNKNYRVMKFFEPMNKNNKARGYVRLDIRGMRGNIIVSAENLGDARSTSEVYLYKDSKNKIKLGDINNRRGILKKSLTFGSNNAIEDYNVCAVVKDNKIVLYSNLYSTCSKEQIKKLEADHEENKLPEIEELHKESVVENTENVSERELATKQDEEQEVGEEIDQVTDEAETKVAESMVTESKDEKANEAIAVQEVQDIEEAKNNEEDKIVEKAESVFNQEFAKDIPVEEMKKEAKSATARSEKYKKTTVASAIDINDKREEVKEEVEAQGKKIKNKFEESLYNALRGYQKVEPLSVKLKDFHWWYIPYDETGIRNGFLPYFNQIISSYYPYPMSNRVTTCSSLMKKYGHYIFGIYLKDGDIANFVYGVPGQFTKEEQPYKGITGFKNWAYNEKEKKGKHGYWLAFVDPKTGQVTEPPQVEVK